MSLIIPSVVSKVVGKIADIVKEAVTDKDKANEIVGKIYDQFITGELANVSKELEARAAIVTAEANGNWLQRSFRPITGFVFLLLITAKWMGFAAPGVTEAIELEILSIIKVILIGYVTGRSVEKIAATFGGIVKK